MTIIIHAEGPDILLCGIVTMRISDINDDGIEGYYLPKHEGDPHCVIDIIISDPDGNNMYWRLMYYEMCVILLLCCVVRLTLTFLVTTIGIIDMLVNYDDDIMTSIIVIGRVK